jgi:hypothetical protein
MSFKENYKEQILSEGKFDIVKEMVRDNDHDGARMEVCKLLKNTRLQKAYEGIDNINRHMGHSPQELIKVRRMLDDDLYRFAKGKFSKEDYEEFKSSL